jgi:nucleotide-binding universal stress UspA family protein
MNLEVAMYNRILVPLDGSEVAEAALPRAEALARLAPSTLYLLRAAPPEEELAAATYLETVAARLRARDLVVETLPVPGEPAAMIVWEAVQRHADVIVMSTHGRSGRGRGVLGSVADQVLHRTARPVLLVQADESPAGPWPCRILVPLDGSELAEDALVHARALAGGGGEILLYEAIAPTTPGDAPRAENAIAQEMLAETQADAERYLDTVAAAPRAAGYRVRTAAEHGRPVERIVSYARQEQVDLIVISSHGRSGVARWLLGSVADELVRLGPAPLLLLRPLIAVAERPLAAARAEGMLQRAAPLPPPTILALDGQEVRLVRAALENLLWDVPWDEPLATKLQTLLAQLPTASTGADGEPAEERTGSGAVASPG